MPFVFWALATAMLLSAIGILVIPLSRSALQNRIPLIAVSVLVPATTMGLYSQVGSPNADSAGGAQPHLAQIMTNPTSGQRTIGAAASVGSLVDGLKHRLEQDPGDAEDWLLLARSYDHLGRPAAAALAYERAQSLGKTDRDLEISLSGEIAVVQEPAPDSGAILQGRVSLSSDAASRVEPGDTVFIFAKASADQRVPVAALRKRAADLPLDFVLTDKQAMIAGTHLADYETLIVTARVSRSGLASDSVENLEVWSDPVPPGHAGRIELVIAADWQVGAQSNE
jgi:hypothetical protein